MKERWQTEKNYLDEAIQRRASGPSFSEANVGSTLGEKECQERMGLLEDQISKQKAKMKEALETKSMFELWLVRAPLFEEANRALTKFLTKISEVNKGRVQSVGKLLFQEHKKKGVITKEFESVAAVENATMWLSRKRKAYAERGDNNGVDKVALHSGASQVLLHLFLGEHINGLVLSYMTRSEAHYRVQVVRSALSSLSAPSLDMDAEAWSQDQSILAVGVKHSEKLWCDIENYDRGCSALLQVQVKVELPGNEERTPFLLNKWLVAN